MQQRKGQKYFSGQYRLKVYTIKKIATAECVHYHQTFTVVTHQWADFMTSLTDVCPDYSSVYRWKESANASCNFCKSDVYKS